MSDLRYPLAWPDNWPRTPAKHRRRAGWRHNGQPLTIAQAIDRLEAELRRLGATDETLSTNLTLSLTGAPRSGQPEPLNPGAAVYFKLDARPRCLASDRWDRAPDNIAALAQHIDALRRIDRYGVGTLERAFAGYAALPPKRDPWWIVLGVQESATLDEAEAAYRRLVRQLHPDLREGEPIRAGHEQTVRLNMARDEARQVHGVRIAGAEDG